MKSKVLVDLERKHFHQDAVEMLSPVANLHFQPITKKEFVAEHGDAVAIIAGHVRVNEGLLQAVPGLRIVARFGVGYDNVDVGACTKRGVYVTITPDVLSAAVADLAIGLMLCLSRRILEADRYVRKEWVNKFEDLPYGVDLEGKTLGIIGLGRIGSRVAERAKGFGMNILYNDIVQKEAAECRLGVKRVSLEELLQEADFVTLHVPLYEKTQGMIGKRELSLMKKTAFLINTSRGDVVDQKALTKFLRNRSIAGAGLDVFHKEPVPSNDPILRLDNVVLTPHAGSATIETRRRMAMASAKEVIRVLKGERPVNLVPEQVGKIP